MALVSEFSGPGLATLGKKTNAHIGLVPHGKPGPTLLKKATGGTLGPNEARYLLCGSAKASAGSGRLNRPIYFPPQQCIMSAYSQLKQDVQAKQQRLWVKQPDKNQLADINLATIAIEAIEVLTTVPRESIQVNARNGWLHLQGTVNHQQQRAIVEDVTRQLPGVRGIVDSISIEAPFNNENFR